MMMVICSQIRESNATLLLTPTNYKDATYVKAFWRKQVEKSGKHAGREFYENKTVTPPIKVWADSKSGSVPPAHLIVGTSFFSFFSLYHMTEYLNF